jgi:hypothetical protein
MVSVLCFFIASLNQLVCYNLLYSLDLLFFVLGLLLRSLRINPLFVNRN